MFAFSITLEVTGTQAEEGMSMDPFNTVCVKSLKLWKTSIKTISCVEF